MKRLALAMVLPVAFSLTSVQADDSETLSSLRRMRKNIDHLIMQIESDRFLKAKEVWTNQRVSFRTRDGYYLSATHGGGYDVVANVRSPKASEVFLMEYIDDRSARLRTREGYYVGARLGGGGNVDATIRTPGTSEIFTLEWLNDERTQLRLRTREGFYIHPDQGGGHGVDARVVNPKNSEVLTLVAATDS